MRMEKLMLTQTGQSVVQKHKGKKKKNKKKSSRHGHHGHHASHRGRKHKHGGGGGHHTDLAPLQEEPTTISSVFEELDEDGDGAIEYEELESWVTRASPGYDRRRLTKLFRELDRDGNRRIDLDELEDGLRNNAGVRKAAKGIDALRPYLRASSASDESAHKHHHHHHHHEDERETRHHHHHSEDDKEKRNARHDCLHDLFGKVKGEINLDEFLDAVCDEESNDDDVHTAEKLFDVFLDVHGKDGRVDVRKMPHILKREEEARRLARRLETFDDLISAIKR